MRRIKHFETNIFVTFNLALWEKKGQENLTLIIKFNIFFWRVMPIDMTLSLLALSLSLSLSLYIYIYIYIYYYITIDHWTLTLQFKIIMNRMYVLEKWSKGIKLNWLAGTCWSAPSCFLSSWSSSSATRPSASSTLWSSPASSQAGRDFFKVIQMTSFERLSSYHGWRLFNLRPWFVSQRYSCLCCVSY